VENSPFYVLVGRIKSIFTFGFELNLIIFFPMKATFCFLAVVSFCFESCDCYIMIKTLRSSCNEVKEKSKFKQSTITDNN